MAGAAGGRHRAAVPSTGGSWSGVSASVRRPAIAKATLHVTQTLTLRARPAAARVGTRIKLRGVAAPTAQQLGAARPAVRLRMERKSGSRWVKVASVAADGRSADGAFSWMWRPKPQRLVQGDCERGGHGRSCSPRRQRSASGSAEATGAASVRSAPLHAALVRRVHGNPCILPCATRGSFRAPHPAPKWLVSTGSIT